MKLLLHCVVFIRASLQIRVVSQEVRLTASQLDELYNMFKVSQILPVRRYLVVLLSNLGIHVVLHDWSYHGILKSFHHFDTLV